MYYIYKINLYNLYSRILIMLSVNLNTSVFVIFSCYLQYLLPSIKGMNRYCNRNRGHGLRARWKRIFCRFKVEQQAYGFYSIYPFISDCHSYRCNHCWCLNGCAPKHKKRTCVCANIICIHMQIPWWKYRIWIHSEPIKTIPIHSDICIRANANHSEPIRKTFCISFGEKR